MEKMNFKVPIKDEDYVKIYALALQGNSEFFKQHKILVDSQIKASRQIFRRKFGGDSEEFKKNARRYLKKLGLVG